MGFMESFSGFMKETSKMIMNDQDSKLRSYERRFRDNPEAMEILREKRERYENTREKWERRYGDD